MLNKQFSLPTIEWKRFNSSFDVQTLSSPINLVFMQHKLAYILQDTQHNPLRTLQNTAQCISNLSHVNLLLLVSEQIVSSGNRSVIKYTEFH